VALKFLPAEMAQDAQALERFQREAQAASQLNHPGICTVHAIDQHDGQHFIAMELLEGETLAERIRAGRSSSRSCWSSGPRSPTRSSPRTRRGSCTAT
jgi:serine/threonine protein kinase